MSSERGEQVPLTVCPTSNVALKVVDQMSQHPLPAMIGAGLLVSVNSDDPAYFGAYVGDNYRSVRDHLVLDDATIMALARNSIVSSFLDETRKSALIGGRGLADGRGRPGCSPRPRSRHPLREAPR